ncbi:hypothetical protein, partial [Acerihabitans sp.]|uniref:hypothetical protein n=1 Tax=Acerihabitans sp. TaxID=2811394 RepID=UPI002ED80DC1
MARQNDAARCARCRFCRRARADIERDIPGLSALGSAFGASLGDSRLCLRHDRLVSPDDRCAVFEPTLK